MLSKKHKIVISLAIVLLCLSLYLFKREEEAQTIISAHLPSNADSGQVLGVREESTPESAERGISATLDQAPLRKKTGEPDLGDGHYAVLDLRSQEIIFENSAEQKVPLASLTKVASALTVLALNDNPDFYHIIQADDLSVVGSSHLRPGDEVSLVDLLTLALVASDNGAAQALASASGLSTRDFVGKMESTMDDAGLPKMEFADPSGLSGGNRGTASEVARLLGLAAENPVLAEIMSRTEALVYTKSGRRIIAPSTNQLQGRVGGPILGKTGFTNAAGGCFAGLWETDGHQYVVAVLHSANQSTRFREAQALATWTKTAFSWSE